MELEISYLQFHVLLLKSGAFIRKLQVGVVRCGFFFLLCCKFTKLLLDYLQINVIIHAIIGGMGRGLCGIEPEIAWLCFLIAGNLSTFVDFANKVSDFSLIVPHFLGKSPSFQSINAEFRAKQKRRSRRVGGRDLRNGRHTGGRGAVRAEMWGEWESPSGIVAVNARRRSRSSRPA